MEIERKFLIRELPENLADYPHEAISQAYICTAPVIRVRKKGESHILTLKGGGMLARQEIEMPIPEESFQHLLGKTDGILIEKTRYRIPEEGGLTIELDVFGGIYKGFCMAEVEFPDLDRANTYQPPAWFGPEVTMDRRFHNSCLSSNSPEEAAAFMEAIRSM